MNKPVAFYHTALLFAFFLLLMASSVYAQRDRIVTQAGEAIRCKILEETSIRFSYSYVNPTGKWAKNEIFKNLVKEFQYDFYEADLAGQQAPEKNKQKSQKAISGKGLEAKPVKTDELQITKHTENKTAVAPKLDSLKENPDQNKILRSPKPLQKASDTTASKPTYTSFPRWRLGLKGGIGNIWDKNFKSDNQYRLYQEKLMKGMVFGADIGLFSNKMDGYRNRYYRFSIYRGGK